MNKRQRIIDTAKIRIQINQKVSTLAIKSILDANFPNETWSQHYISNTLREAFNDKEIPNLRYRYNDGFREYFVLVPVEETEVQEEPICSRTECEEDCSCEKPVYSYTFSPSTGVNITLTGDSTQSVIESAKTYDIGLRYSESRKEFNVIADMQQNHLFNAFKKEIVKAVDSDELMKVMMGPLSMEFGSRAIHKKLGDMVSKAPVNEDKKA